MPARQQGAQAEQIALAYLNDQGLQLIEQNYHCRGGEIDLIMQDGNTLVFVEVRYRKTAAFGSALESVTLQKQQRIIHTAQHYIQRQRITESNYRFDVIAISPTASPIWIKDAFQLN